MKNLLKVNLYFVIIYFLFYIFPEKYLDYSIIRYVRSIIELIVFLVLSGLNLTALLQIKTRQQFTKLESLSIASIFALIIMPFTLLIEYHILGETIEWLPFLNTTATLFPLVFFYFSSKPEIIIHPPKIESKKLDILAIIGNFIKTPYFLSYVLYFSFVFIIFGAYYVLPELDPYYWLEEISKNFAINHLPEINGYRPLFSALAYIFVKSSHIDTYAYFKYVLPILSGLILIPATLLASQFKSNIQKTLILLIPFTSASSILYLQFPIPQAILTISLAYFFIFLTYAWIKKEEFFFYLGGVVAFFSIFYHEASAIIFIVWFLVFLIFDWKKLRNIIISNRLSSILFFALILTNFYSSIQNIFSFPTVWIQKILIASASINLNFYFPAQYANVDGNQMGWLGLDGIIKYYGYYVGPVVILILTCLAYFIYFRKNFRDYIKNETMKSRSIVTIILLFLIFFSIAEIFPRLFSLAMLPERAWSFGGIFAFIFIILIFKYFDDKLKIIYYLIIFSLLMNLTGALYINDLKKFVTTKEHTGSAEWIKTNLPQNRVIFSNKKTNFLKVHSQSKPVSVTSQFYSNQEAFGAELAAFENRPLNIQLEYDAYLSTLEQNFNQLKQKEILLVPEIIPIVNSITAETEKISMELANYNKPNAYSLYIYYTDENENNPYLSRPYYQKSTQNNFIFDQQLEKFQRVYVDNVGDIIIWKIL